ncbi:MAG: hypothetical protein V4555_00930 [Acidobacteriota bacterium]
MMNRRLQFVAATARPLLAAVLIALFCTRPAFAMVPAATEDDSLPSAPLPSAPSPAGPQKLEITILDGEGALNNIKQRVAREPIVQVQDENHKPVAGALILFSVRPGYNGASATFNGGATFSTRTDANGQAVGTGLLPNAIKGNFTITVTATLGALTVVALIHQMNGSGGGGSNNSQSSSGANATATVAHHGWVKWVLISGGVAGGAVLAVALTHTTNTQISVGAGGVGHP